MRAEEYVRLLNARLECNVRIADAIPDFVSGKTRRNLKAGTAKGWFDDTSGTVCLYRPNLSKDSAGIDADVAFLQVMRQGLKGLLGDKSYSFACMMWSRMSPEDGRTFDRKEAAAAGDRWFRSLPDRHVKQWDTVAKTVSGITGLTDSWQLADSLCHACALHRKQERAAAVLNNDFGALDERMQRELSDPSKGGYLSFGTASETFLRIGYPKAEVGVTAETVRRFLTRNSLEPSVFQERDLTAALHTPLMVISDTGAQRKDGRMPLNMFVTNIYIPQKGYLAVGMRNEKDLIKGFADEKMNHIHSEALTFFSEYRILVALSSRQSDIRFLLPKHAAEGTTYVVSDILKGMEGKTAEELGMKKSVSGNVPDLAPVPLSRRLSIAANIVNDFRNPMLSSKRLQHFGSILFDDRVSRHLETVREMRNATAANSSEPSRKVRQKTFAEKLDTSIDTKCFSAAAVLKMHKAGVHTVRGIISLGEKGYRQSFGPRAFKDAQKYLDSMGLSFDVVQRMRIIPEKELADMSEKERSLVHVTDLAFSMRSVPDSILDRQVMVPRGIGDTCFTGANCVNLVSKMVGTSRWRNCNIFLTRQECEDIGYVIKADAVPCHLRDAAGNPAVVFNLAETTFASTYTEIFDAVAEMARKTSAQVPGQVRNLIYGVKDGGMEQAEATYRFIDISVRKAMKEAVPSERPASLQALTSMASARLGFEDPFTANAEQRKVSAKDIYQDMLFITK